MAAKKRKKIIISRNECDGALEDIPVKTKEGRVNMGNRDIPKLFR
jgi:hypothetical protein